MLKLSDRAHPAWVRRPNPSVGQVRLHWLAAHCVGERRPGIGEPLPTASAAPSPSEMRHRARVSVMADHRCADCGAAATELIAAPARHAAPGAQPSGSTPLCVVCRDKRDGGPLADVMHRAMARYTVAARSA